MGIESGRRKTINHDFTGTGKSSLESKICNFHDSASLLVDCKSLTLGWISLTLYKVVIDSYSPLPRLCFSGWSKNQDGRLASEWLRHFRLLLWTRWTDGVYWHVTVSNISTCPTKYVFSDRWENKNGRLYHIFDFSSESAEWISKKLDRKKILTSSTKFVFFGPIRKPISPPRPLICWDIFGFSSETVKQNSSKYCRSLAAAFSTSPLKLLSRIKQNWTGSRISMASTKVLFFGPIRKPR